MGELYFCLDAIQALAANTPDGETRSRTYALEELTEFYPVEASIGFSYSRLEDERWPETLLRDYFAVPVLPGASVTLSVEKSGSGDIPTWEWSSAAPGIWTTITGRLPTGTACSSPSATPM